MVSSCQWFNLYVCRGDLFVWDGFYLGPCAPRRSCLLSARLPAWDELRRKSEIPTRKVNNPLEHKKGGNTVSRIPIFDL